MNFGSDLKFVRRGGHVVTGNAISKCLFKGYYGLQITLNGAIYAAVGDNPLEFATGPVAFISYPGSPFTYGSPDGTFREAAWLCFEGERVSRYIDSGLLELRERQLFIPIHDSRKFVQTLDLLMHNLAMPGNAVHHARAVLLLEELLLQLHEFDGDFGGAGSPYRAQLKQLCARIVHEPELEWDFQREAKAIQLSYAHFRRIFTRETGLSPKQYLLECRLRKAEQLLVSDNGRISEIAEMCGFDGVFHFYRIFKKHRNISPTQFRKVYGVSGND